MTLSHTRPTVARYRHALLRLLGRQTDPADEARIKEVVCPAETLAAKPAVCLPGQIDKVSATPFGRLADVVAVALGRPQQWAPTIRYEVQDAVLVDGSVYAGRSRLFRRDRRAISGSTEVIRLEEAALVSSFHGCRYFGHWLMDDCATYELTRGFGAPLSVATAAWPDKATYAEIFGQSWEPTRRAVIKRLSWFDDISHNSDKARRYRLLRRKIRDRFGPGEAGGLVYLRRGPTGSPRVMRNEAAIVELLAARGATILEMENTPVEATIKALLTAKMVIGVEGSHLCHAVFAIPENASVLAIQPPERFFNAPKDWTDALGIRYGFVVGDPAGDAFELDADDLLRTIDLMDS